MAIADRHKPDLVQMHEWVVCNLCGSDDAQQILPDTRPHQDAAPAWSAYQCTHPGYGVHPPIVRCRVCGFVYANPRYAQQIIDDSYEAVIDDLYLQEEAGRVATFERRLKWVEGFTGPAAGRRLLDVGAYTGVFTELAAKAGWDAWGVEPSAWAASYAQARGLNVQQGRIEDQAFEPTSFDVITLWDVIEHLPDPAHVLQAAHSLLAPGGWIVVHTMDMDSPFARIMGRRWPWLMEMHIYYFTKKTLSRMLENTGFTVNVVRAEGRYLRLKYLITRIEPYSPFVARLIRGGAGALRLDEASVPINFGDLVTAYARKPG